MDILLYARKHMGSHTPLGRLVAILPSALHQVVSQDVGHLDGVVNLHAVVDTNTAVLVEVAAGLLASSDHHASVI